MDIDWIEVEDITPDTAESILGDADGIIVPGGFGDRGIEGMINAANYAREHNIPYLGICLGMQIAGTSPDGRLVESITLPANDFFVGVQYHPEFKSRPNSAHPLLREFIKASGGRK